MKISPLSFIPLFNSNLCELLIPRGHKHELSYYIQNPRAVWERFFLYYGEEIETQKTQN